MAARKKKKSTLPEIEIFEADESYHDIPLIVRDREGNKETRMFQAAVPDLPTMEVLIELQSGVGDMTAKEQIDTTVRLLELLFPKNSINDFRGIAIVKVIEFVAHTIRIVNGGKRTEAQKKNQSEQS